MKRTQLKRKARLASKTMHKRRAVHNKRAKPIAKLGHKDLWPVFREYIRNRDGNTCITCGRWCEGSNRHAGHMFASSTCGMALRYHPWNVHIQCGQPCNGAGNGEGAIYAEKVKAKYGERTYQFMYELRNRRFKIDWQAAIDYYKDPPIAHSLVLPFLTEL